jgi:hypothetical protein
LAQLVQWLSLTHSLTLSLILKHRCKITDAD